MLALTALTLVSGGARADAQSAGSSADDALTRPNLTIIIIRHGEKPAHGDNLSCQGMNRALALPAVLFNRFGRPDWSYVPRLKQDKGTSHARMLQTLTPYAVQQNLTINTQFAEDQVSAAARHVLGRSGTVLMVWEHSQIPPLARALGVPDPPSWEKSDFDSVWRVTPGRGKARLEISSQGLHPQETCSF